MIAHVQLLTCIYNIKSLTQRCRLSMKVAYTSCSCSARFHLRINMGCVNHVTGAVLPLSSCPSMQIQVSLMHGLFYRCIYSFGWQVMQVDLKKFNVLANWRRVTVLTQLKKDMAAAMNRKLVQPPERTCRASCMWLSCITGFILPVKWCNMLDSAVNWYNKLDLGCYLKYYVCFLSVLITGKLNSSVC
jgi:hypothetical protein